MRSTHFEEGEHHGAESPARVQAAKGGAGAGSKRTKVGKSGKRR